MCLRSVTTNTLLIALGKWALRQVKSNSLNVLRVTMHFVLHLLLAASSAVATALSSEKVILVTKSEGDHFPRMPSMPRDAVGGRFVAVSQGVGEGERAAMVADLVGPPLGADDGDYDKLTYGASENEGEIEDDEDDAAFLTEGDLFEGDISGVYLTSLDRFSNNGEDLDSVLRNAVVNTYQRWPGGVIPYAISRSFSRRDRRVIRRAAEEIAKRSCVRWKPRDWKTDRDYVHILKDDGCYSKVGRVRGRSGGGQVLSLGSGCVEFGTVLHEMLHAAGFWHEQSRPDRDDHVVVNWRNIRRGMEDNFARYSRGEVSTLELPYETGSVMHYSSTAFSRNGLPTIVRKSGGPSGRLGQRKGLTELDVKKLNALYECNNAPLVTTSVVTTATIVDPNCQDKLGRFMCFDWFAQGACFKFKEFMSGSCPRTCGQCPTVTVTRDENGECADRDARCGDWTRETTRQCIDSFEFMAVNCARTCRFCEEEGIEERGKSGASLYVAMAPFVSSTVVLAIILF